MAGAGEQSSARGETSEFIGIGDGGVAGNYIYPWLLVGHGQALFFSLDEIVPLCMVLSIFNRGPLFPGAPVPGGF